MSDDDYCPIIVSKSGVILDGNHRVDDAIKLGRKTIRGIVIDAEIVELNLNDLHFGWKVEKHPYWIFHRLWIRIRGRIK